VKKVYIVFLILLFFLSGCSNSESVKNQHNQKLDAFQQEYAQKNDIDVIWKESNESEELIAFNKLNEYGIALFYFEDEENEENEVKYDVSKIAMNDELKKVVYTQIIGKNDYYIGIFIDDEELLQKASSIKITFADDPNEEMFAIQQTIIKTKAQILQYDSDNQRIIKSIYIKNDNNQNIYQVK
jgi:hypothetical protein